MEPPAHAGGRGVCYRGATCIRLAIFALACVLAVGGNDVQLDTPTSELGALGLTDSPRPTRPLRDGAVDRQDATQGQGEGLDATPTPEPVVAPTGVPYVPEGRAAVICSVMPDCQKALRVALCESGPDYSAPFDGLHIGPFQIAEVHADKFTKRGWDYYEDGDDPYRNSVIALEILNNASGWWPADWPFCGWK